MVNQLKRLILECSKTDYSNKQSVRIHNTNVRKIRDIVENIREHDLSQLLDDELCKSWIAFQLAENLKSNSEEIRNKVTSALTEIAKGNGLNAFAAEKKLKELSKS